MPATIKWSAQNSNVYRAYRIMSSDSRSSIRNSTVGVPVSQPPPTRHLGLDFRYRQQKVTR